MPCVKIKFAYRESRDQTVSQLAAPVCTITDSQRERFERNNVALARFQPDVAGLVRSTAVSNAVIPAIGRDESPTFQIVHDGGAASWFGRSSMPTISAPNIFADAQFRGGNAALPGMLTGLEPLALLERMPKSAALFVLEDDPRNIALAFHLYEYGEAIRLRRLLFVLTDRFAANFTALIRRHPGYEMPGHLYHVPQRPTAELIDLQRRLESAGQAAVDLQNEVINTALLAIATRSYGSTALAPRVAVLCADSRGAALEQVNRIVRALQELGWVHAVCAPFTPDKCHALARIRAVECADADVVLCIGHGADHLRGALPPDLPVVSWLLEPIGGELQSPPPSRPLDVVVETRSAEGGHGSLDDGAARTRLRVEPAADDRAFQVRPRTREPDGQTDVDVAIPVEIPDDRAEACGISLASHVMLWREVLRIVRERIDRPNPPDADLVLADAGRAAGLSIDDGGIREQFTGLIRARAIPASRARSLAAACHKAGLRVAVFGANWVDPDILGVRWGGEVPTVSGVNRLFDQARVVALPTCDVHHVQMALDTLCTGATVCLRADAGEFARRYPGLTEVAALIEFAPTSRTLAKRAKEIVSASLCDPEAREHAARTEALARHTVASRLRWIIDQVRVRKRATISTNSGSA